jgi:hypothetical protein
MVHCGLGASCSLGTGKRNYMSWTGAMCLRINSHETGVVGLEESGAVVCAGYPRRTTGLDHDAAIWSGQSDGDSWSIAANRPAWEILPLVSAPGESWNA